MIKIISLITLLNILFCGATDEKPIVEIEIDTGNFEKILESFNILKLAIFSQAGDLVKRVPEDAEIDEIRQFTTAIIALLEPKPWVILTLGNRKMFIASINVNDTKYFVAAEATGEIEVTIGILTEFFKTYLPELLNPEEHSDIQDKN